MNDVFFLSRPSLYYAFRATGFKTSSAESKAFDRLLYIEHSVGACNEKYSHKHPFQGAWASRASNTVFRPTSLKELQYEPKRRPTVQKNRLNTGAFFNLIMQPNRMV